MPVYQKIDGEMMESFSEDARFVKVTEKTFVRDLGSVESDARTLSEMVEAVAEDGQQYQLTEDLRKQIYDTMSALTDLHSKLPMPKVRAAA